MRKPSDQWKKLRRASLERARRNAIDPLAPLHWLYALACVVYLAGFVALQFHPGGTDLSVLLAVVLVPVAIAGLLIPLLTGSVLTLHFASRRLDALANES